MPPNLLRQLLECRNTAGRCRHVPLIQLDLGKRHISHVKDCADSLLELISPEQVWPGTLNQLQLVLLSFCEILRILAQCILRVLDAACLLFHVIQDLLMHQGELGFRHGCAGLVDAHNGEQVVLAFAGAALLRHGDELFASGLVLLLGDNWDLGMSQILQLLLELSNVQDQFLFTLAGTSFPRHCIKFFSGPGQFIVYDLCLLAELRICVEELLLQFGCLSAASLLALLLVASSAPFTHSVTWKGSMQTDGILEIVRCARGDPSGTIPGDELHCELLLLCERLAELSEDLEPVPLMEPYDLISVHVVDDSDVLVPP